MRITQLTQRAKAPATDRARQFVNRLVEENDFFRVLNNWALGAMEDKYRPATGGQTLSSRAPGSNYSAGQMSPSALQSAELAIHGFILKYDEAYRRDHDNGLGIDMDMWLEQELEERAVDTADAIMDLIVAGDGQGDNIAGLSTILDGNTNIPGLGITGVINATQDTNQSPSFDLSNSDNYDLFMEQFEKWKKELNRLDIVIVNRSLGARLTTIFRKFHMYQMSTDRFGEPVEMIAGVPMVRVDDTVITNDEEDDASTPNTDTTSMYIATNRTGHWTIRSNSGLAVYDVGELQDEMNEALKFEVTGFNEIRTKRAIRRVRNIKL